MSNIEIARYDHSHAKEVADMWNKSGKNWGGDEVVYTTEDIINQYNNMGSICAFIALDGKEVVGFCSFGEYKQDEGASYIPLLNVRPDYLGKKIGKRLLLECVNLAMEAEWPRLDLYTWQGNDKAVPLYKKCGFFWERRDDTTHLMNFIPYVMRTEAVKHYFDEIDWYKDSLREIKVESDGRTEGDFEYYDYVWKKEDINLKMEFERRGRGLTCIETDDYLIRARVSKQNLVFGRQYEIQYEIENKSGKELHVSINGQNDKNIRFDLEYEDDIIGNETVIGEFGIDRVEEEQSIWRTHPCVKAEIYINGKQALFKVGINPKFPVKLNMTCPKPVSIGDEAQCYIDVENNFDEDIAIAFKLSNSEFAAFNNPVLGYELKAGQRASKALNCICTGHGFYDEDPVVNIRTANEEMEFKTKLTGVFQGYISKFHGEDENGWYIYNGQYCIELRKRDNFVIIYGIKRDNDDDIFVRPPQLGKPYSLEFFNKRPDEVEFKNLEDKVMIKASYSSESVMGIQVDYFMELYQDGLSNIYYEVKNTSGSNIHSDIYVNQQVFYLIIEGYLPYDGQIIKTPGADGLVGYHWDFSKVDQNWVFSHNSVTKGFGWPSDSSMTFNYAYFSIENKLGNIGPGESFKAKPMVIAINTFDSWKEFAGYMGNDIEQNMAKKTKQSFSCIVNKGNPFIEDSLRVDLQDYKKKPVKGTIEIQSQEGCCQTVKESVELDIGDSYLIDLDLIKRDKLDILEIQANLTSKTFSRKKAVFFKDTKQIKVDSYIDQDKKVYEADNGVIKIKASPEYSIGLYSVEHDGLQWFDNSFPKPSIKGWWNFWTGGIGYRPTGIAYASIQEEYRSAEHVKINDHYGNQWAGIKTTLEIIKNKKYKGLKIEQYFLMMQNVPVLCNMAVVKQNTGKFMSDVLFKDELFIKAGKDLNSNWAIYTGDDGEEIKYKCVETEFDVLTNKNYMTHGAKESEYNMIRLVNENHSLAFFNTNGTAWGENVKRISAPNGATIHVKPSFLIFSNKRLNNVMLGDLTELSFDVE